MTQKEFQEALREARAEDRKNLVEAFKEVLTGFFDEKKPAGATGPQTKEDLKEIMRELLSEKPPAAEEKPKKLFGML